MGMRDNGPVETVEEFITGAPPQVQLTLYDLQAQLLDLLPGASTRISYQVPVFVLGKQVVGMGYSAKSVSLYTMSPPLLRQIGPQLRELGCTVSGATVGVPHGHTFPAEAVERIVQGRLVELGITVDGGSTRR